MHHFSVSGKIVAEDYIEYPLITTPENYIEQDADLWWTLVRNIIKKVISKSGIDPSKIPALSISSQGISIVPVDEEGHTLSRAISWLDVRSQEQSAEIIEKHGSEEIFMRTGKRVSPSYTLSKLLWIKENMPDLYNNTYKFLMPLDFLTSRFTGKYVTDHTMASGTMMYNITDKVWDRELLKDFGIGAKLLPDIRYLGSPVGRVLPVVAEETGLSPDTLVVLGAQDQKCAAIGAGIGKGICTVSLGTATAIETIWDSARFDRRMRVPCFTFDEKSWVLESVIATSGVSLKWMRNSLFEDKTYPEIDDMISKAASGSSGLYFYPHLEGAASPYWDPEAKGFLYGIGLATAKEDVVRALFEGIAYQIRINIDIHRQLGSEINEIRIFGGGSKSSIWCQIIADITGREVKTLYTSETANLGAAIIAGIGCGIYKSYEEAIGQMELFNKSYKPDKSKREVYDTHYERYKEIQARVLKKNWIYSDK